MSRPRRKRDENAAYRFEFDRRALREAEEARDRMAESSPEWADRWYQGLFEQIETLKTFPRRCPRTDVGDPNAEMRELLYGRHRNVYRIFFTIRGDLIRIVSVWAAPRDTITF